MEIDYGYEIGIDIGGTFTDFALFRRDGELSSLKVPSVPTEPIKAIIQGLEMAAEKKMIDPVAVRYFSHGSTIGVNTLIQRNGAKLCLFVTEGFGDILEIQRLRLADAYDLYGTRPVPLVPRERVMQIKERILADGRIFLPLEKSSVNRAIEQAISESSDGIVVCLLHSYKNPQHELMVKKMVMDQAPQLFVCCSSEVWPEIREYERAMVAIINSYVQPKVKGYLESMEHTIKERGITIIPYITKSNGGVMTARRAKTSCAETLQSGTAAGVVGAAFISKLSGCENIFTLDMGGTSADVALVTGGQLCYSKEEDVMGFPLIIPQVRVSSIGAGGGSVAWVDPFGVLKVGPESVGAEPGPSCYGHGGTKATVTDAFLVCGFLNPDYFAGGQMKLYPNLSENVIGKLGQSLNLGLIDAAQAIIEVVTGNMYAEFSRIISKEGVDPHDFTLVAFGGAGPSVACFLAEELKIPKVLFPATPGTLSALGNIVSEVKSDFIKSVALTLNEVTVDHINEPLRELKSWASKWLAEEGPSLESSVIQLSADMRYVGQSFEVEVPIHEAWFSANNLSQIVNAFHRVHKDVYGHSDEASPVEMVSLRATILGKRAQPQLKKIPKAENKIELTEKTIYYNRKSHRACIYNRKDLHWGHLLDGPAIVEGSDSTGLIIEGFTGAVDCYGNIIIEKREGY